MRIFFVLVIQAHVFQKPQAGSTDIIHRLLNCNKVLTASFRTMLIMTTFRRSSPPDVIVMHVFDLDRESPDGSIFSNHVVFIILTVSIENAVLAEN
jgi:hypothetical protein